MKIYSVRDIEQDGIKEYYCLELHDRYCYVVDSDAEGRKIKLWRSEFKDTLEEARAHAKRYARLKVLEMYRRIDALEAADFDNMQIIQVY